MPRSSIVRMTCFSQLPVRMTTSPITSISCVPFQVSSITVRSRALRPTYHRCLNKNHYLVVADQGIITFISITQTPHHDTSPLSVAKPLNRQLHPLVVVAKMILKRFNFLACRPSFAQYTVVEQSIPHHVYLPIVDEIVPIPIRISDCCFKIKTHVKKIHHKPENMLNYAKKNKTRRFLQQPPSLTNF